MSFLTAATVFADFASAIFINDLDFSSVDSATCIDLVIDAIAPLFMGNPKGLPLG